MGDCGLTPSVGHCDVWKGCSAGPWRMRSRLQNYGGGRPTPTRLRSLAPGSGDMAGRQCRDSVLPREQSNRS